MSSTAAAVKPPSDLEIRDLFRKRAAYLLVLVEKSGVRNLPASHEHFEAIWSKIAATVNDHFVDLRPLTVDDCKAILGQYETAR